MALRPLPTPQPSFCSWPRTYTRTQRRSSQHVSTQMWWGAQAPSAKRHFITAPGVFSQQYWLHQRDKVQKARKPTHFGTRRQGSWLKLWPCMPVKKCKACYYMSRNPFWKENANAFISVGIHSKDCTHFVLLTQHLIISTQKIIWFCHQVSNFVVLLFPLKQMIAANRAKSG